jgi:hypothetical protein
MRFGPTLASLRAAVWPDRKALLMPTVGMYVIALHLRLLYNFR